MRLTVRKLGSMGRGGATNVTARDNAPGGGVMLGLPNFFLGFLVYMLMTILHIVKKRKHFV